MSKGERNLNAMPTMPRTLRSAWWSAAALMIALIAVGRPATADDLKDGRTAFQAGRYEDALKILEQIVEIEPTYQRAWARMGQMQRKLTRYEDAVKSYARALEIDPHFGLARVAKATEVGGPTAASESQAAFTDASTGNAAR